MVEFSTEHRAPNGHFPSSMAGPMDKRHSLVFDAYKATSSQSQQNRSTRAGVKVSRKRTKESSWYIKHSRDGTDHIKQTWPKQSCQHQPRDGNSKVRGMETDMIQLHSLQDRSQILCQHPSNPSQTCCRWNRVTCLWCESCLHKVEKLNFRTTNKSESFIKNIRGIRSGSVMIECFAIVSPLIDCTTWLQRPSILYPLKTTSLPNLRTRTSNTRRTISHKSLYDLAKVSFTDHHFWQNGCRKGAAIGKPPQVPTSRMAK